jgi:hypothetical protein
MRFEERLVIGWEEKNILIIGSTYPSLSQKYTELACTGGIVEDTFEMVRLHPVPRRYLEAEHRFKGFQRIRVRLIKHDKDPRPESYRIDPDSIQTMEVVRGERRRKYIENSPHLFRSLEELKDRQKTYGTSMGIVKPKQITDCKIARRTSAERVEWEEKAKGLLGQEVLFGDKLKPLDFPEAKFMIGWECDDIRCVGHKMSLLQWGINELYRKLKNDPDVNEKVLKVMWQRLDREDHVVYVFLGNFRGKQYNFGLMDSCSFPKKSQLALF